MRQVAITAAAILGFSWGCGADQDDAESTSPSAEAAQSVVRDALTSTDPDVCERVASDEFFAAAYPGFEASAARNQCRTEASHEERDAARGVKFAEVASSGDTAEVTVDVEGGEADGQTLAVNLVAIDGEWRIARITGFEASRRLTQRAREASNEGLRSQGFEPDVALCVFDSVGDEVVLSEVDTLLGGRQPGEEYSEALARCQGLQGGS